jgi:hypothetical protein
VASSQESPASAETNAPAMAAASSSSSLLISPAPRSQDGAHPRSGRARINSVETFLRYRTPVTGRLRGTWNLVAGGRAG